jgi:hypothetical protein
MDMGVVSGADASRVLQGSNFSKLKAKAYDNLNRGLVWNTEDPSAAGTYDVLAATLKSVTNNTAYAFGVGQTLDFSIDTATVSTVSHFGDSNLGVYIAVDADKSQYDTPVLQIGGVNLVDVKNSGELSSDDISALSSYEYVFKVPAGVQFNSAPTSVRFYVASKAGVDPSADIVLRVIGKAFYVGADGFTINEDCFNKASGSEILTATPQTVTIDVA